MIQDFQQEEDLPRIHGNYFRRAGMAFDDIRFYYSFEIQLVPVLRGLLQHLIQLSRIRDDLACCFGSFPQNASQDNDRLTGNLVVKSRDYGVVAR